MFLKLIFHLSSEANRSRKTKYLQKKGFFTQLSSNRFVILSRIL